MPPFRFRPWFRSRRWTQRRRFGRTTGFRRRYRPRTKIYRKRRIYKKYHRRPHKVLQWNPPKVGNCYITGFVPLLICTKNDFLKQFGFKPQHNPEQEQCPLFQSGSFGKFSFTLEQLWEWNRRDWNIFSRPTDGYNLCRFMSAKLRCYRHKSLNYIIVIEQEYCQNDRRGWPYYHPSKILFQKTHRLILSKTRSCGGKNYATIKIKPRPTDTNSWFLMAQMATHIQFTVMVTLFELENPFLNPLWDSAVISSSNVTQGTWGHTQKVRWCYNFLWDTGKLNCIYIHNSVDDTPPQNKGYADGIYKETPYYLSLFGLTNDDFLKLWIWAPANNISAVSARMWTKCPQEMYQRILRSGPFMIKGLETAFSINCTYKFHFQFGGPDINDGFNAGDNPVNIPPGCKPTADQFFGGMEAGYIASQADALVNDWEWRRGYLTSRAFKRLTEDPLSTGQNGRSEQGENEQWLSEEEITTLEEDSQEEDSMQKKKKKRHRHSL